MDKTTRFFSWPLFRQSLRANLALLIAVTLVLCMITMVTTYASSIMGGEELSQQTQDAEEDFTTHLAAMAAFDQATGAKLSVEGFKDALADGDTASYEQAFAMMGGRLGAELSIEAFEDDIEQMESEDVDVDGLVSLFEYNFALSQQTGVFSGDKFDVQELVTLVMEQAGMSASLASGMGDMDMTSLLGRVYYTAIGLLPTFLFVVVAANSLVVDQVDRGSMAYVLSTPTRRSAVVITQALYLLLAPLVIVGVACCVRIAATSAFFGEVEAAGIVARYAGMYLVVEAICGICFMGSCIFSRSGSSMAFGGGIAVWCFIASLLGMFGFSDLVDMGIGVEALSRFNDVTLVGLCDYDALATVGTGAVDMAFVPGLVALAAVALACYGIGAARFCKRDLPL